MTPPVLSVRNLAKAFAGFLAVDDVSFDVAAGEVVALIGPNGAGKTTTFNLINGQLHPNAGAVVLEGREVTGATPQLLRRLGAARTFQISSVFASMTVAENMIVALLAERPSYATLAPASDDWSDAANRHLGAAGLRHLADRPAAALAYGDIKRLELALAMTSCPRLLLMDEPTAGMAPGERNGIMQIVTEQARSRGTSILFTEHDMSVVFGHADRVIVMSRGRVIAEGRPDAIRRDPEVRRVYLGAASGD